MQKSGGKPTVYVVSWPVFSVFKIGYTAANRLTRFRFSGGTVLHTWEFERPADAFYVETLLQDVAAGSHLPAFARAEQARDLLGGNGAGYKECYSGTSHDAQEVVTRALHRAMPDAYAREDSQA